VPLKGSCQHGNENLGPIKGREFVSQLRGVLFRLLLAGSCTVAAVTGLDKVWGSPSPLQEYDCGRSPL